MSLSCALAQDRPARFWNLTRHTIAEFYLAPAGTTNWGDNQCKNDKDGTVDSDERLRITGVRGRNLLDRGKGPDILRSLTASAVVE
jgi:hypothetical protein